MSAVTLSAGPTRPVRTAGPVRRTRPVRTAPPARLPAQRIKSRPRGVEAAGHVRLTRRGRVVVTLALLAMLMLAVVMFGGQSAATGEAGTPVPTRTVVVDQGDTLWGIASTVAGSRDVREVVHEIETLNSLPGPELVEGQKLAVPLR